MQLQRVPTSADVQLGEESPLYAQQVSTCNYRFSCCTSAGVCVYACVCECMCVWACMCMDQCLWVLDAFMSNHNLLATSFRPICIYNGITGLAAAVFASVFMRVHTHVCVCVCVCVFMHVYVWMGVGGDTSSPATIGKTFSTSAKSHVQELFDTSSRHKSHVSSKLLAHRLLTWSSANTTKSKQSTVTE